MESINNEWEKRMEQEREKAFEKWIVAREALKLLGFEIKAADNYYRTAEALPNNNAEIICIDCQRYNKKDRFVVRGVYPFHNCHSGTKNPEITISQDKTPEQIAKDITRRFLPDYKVALEASKVKKAQDDDYTTAQAISMERLIKATGDMPSNYDLREHRTSGYLDREGNYSKRFRIEGIEPDHCRLELDCSIDDAVAIIELWKSL